MICPDVEARLGAWADDELPAGERLAVESHLRDCAFCRAEAASVRSLKALLGASAPPLPAPIVIQPVPAAARPVARYALFAAIAATVVMLAAGSFRWTAWTPPPSPASQQTVTDAGASQAGLDCRIGAPQTRCEIETPASFCSSARDCGLPF